MTVKYAKCDNSFYYMPHSPCHTRAFSLYLYLVSRSHLDMSEAALALVSKDTWSCRLE